jgi:signal transduction histidine kinase
MFRTLTARQLVFDVVLSAVCIAIRFTFPFAETTFFLVEAFMIVAMGSALAMRRLSPPIALGIAWVGAVVQMAGGLPPDPANLAILPVLYATAAYGSNRMKWIGLASAGAGTIIATIYFVFILFFGQLIDSGSGASISRIPDVMFALVAAFIGFLGLFGLSWTLGLLTRTRSAARASREAQARAEAEEQHARRLAIVEQERNRIARDMHDVVAHSLAVVIAQADGARYSIGTDPDAAAGALSTISTTAREALGDVRILLGQLRHNQGEGPQPTLADLDRLLEQVRSSGLQVELSGDGDETALGTPQQLAVYRIVQEALTNALRHGDTEQPVEVALEWGVDELTIRIDSALSPERPPATESLGHGLAGMRERASLVGGWLTAEPRRDRFQVLAGIPISIETGVTNV